MGGINKKIWKEAEDLILDFQNNVFFKNRYFVKHKLLDYIKHISEVCCINVNEGNIYYRARIYNNPSSSFNYEKYEALTKLEVSPEKKKQLDALEKSRADALNESRMENPFLGYSESNSFVPPNNLSIGDGRANPSMIKYLYTAESQYTAMAEVRPFLHDKVSIAEIRVENSLVICDLSMYQNEKLLEIEKYLLLKIMFMFSTPINNDSRDYIPTQYISEYIKNLGFDGIRFNSSLHSGGKNITVYNYDKCRAVSSVLYEINDICFDARPITPRNILPLMHTRLLPDLKLKLKEMLEKENK